MTICDELAAVAGFSPSHFKVLFKQAVGAPVHRFIVERRVELIITPSRLVRR